MREWGVLPCFRLLKMTLTTIWREPLSDQSESDQNTSMRVSHNAVIYPKTLRFFFSKTCLALSKTFFFSHLSFHTQVSLVS